MLSIGRKCVKIAMTCTCVTYTEPFVEKILCVQFSNPICCVMYCESIVKSIIDASEGLKFIL